MYEFDNTYVMNRPWIPSGGGIPYPRVYVNHKDNTKYTDIRIVIANGTNDVYRLGNRNLMHSPRKETDDTYINNQSNFTFAHNGVYTSSDWSHSAIIGITFTTQGKMKIFGTDSSAYATSAWAGAGSRPLYPDIPQIWKTKFFTHPDNNTEVTQALGQWGVICRPLKVTCHTNTTTGSDYATCIYDNVHTTNDKIVIYAQEILDGLNQDYENYLYWPPINNASTPIVVSDTYACSPYLECILTIRITWG